MMFPKPQWAGGRASRIAAAPSLVALLTALACCGPAAAQSSFAPDDVSLAYAHGERHRISKVELDLGWVQAQPLWQGENWRLSLRHELVLGQWHVPEASGITELGYSPVFRLERPNANSTFFVEGSIGARLLSHARMSPDSTLSTAFQFADMVGIGMAFGHGSGMQTVGLRFQHQSNADIKTPNPGINFTMLYYRYSF